MISKEITVDDLVGLYRCDMVLNPPEIRVTRWKKSRDDFRYEMQRAVNEIVDELIEKALED